MSWLRLIPCALEMNPPINSFCVIPNQSIQFSGRLAHNGLSFLFFTVAVCLCSQEYAEKSDPAKPVLVELKTQPPASKVVKAFGEPIYLGFSKEYVSKFANAPIFSSSLFWAAWPVAVLQLTAFAISLRCEPCRLACCLVITA